MLYDANLFRLYSSRLCQREKKIICFATSLSFYYILDFQAHASDTNNLKVSQFELLKPLHIVE